MLRAKGEQSREAYAQELSQQQRLVDALRLQVAEAERERDTAAAGVASGSSGRRAGTSRAAGRMAAGR